MSKNPLSQLSSKGQSFWFDNIHRAMIISGELDRMIQLDDLRGITSNPAIFEKAMTSSSDYDSALAQLLSEQPSLDARGYFYALAIQDIQQAADRLRGVYENSNHIDGYVSLEVSPDLAHNTDASIEEARRLFSRIDRPNAMIKIPATKAGIPVIRQLIRDGINVNATLLFSVERYVEVANAFIEGLEERQREGKPLESIASVASFFVSRVDGLIDKQMEARQASPLGKFAIANAKLAYMEYQSLFESERFAKLNGAQSQRLLWASTGTKNANYSDVLYIDSLIGPHTVNTIPPSTADAFRDHGVISSSLMDGWQQAKEVKIAVENCGIELHQCMQQLEDEGVALFAKSFDTLLNAIDQKVQLIRVNNSSAA
ncbi:MAG: transaldolase [Gammaproteobacteria bacterium]|nr:transaldolase [Gammaproteobacteria bacterium]